MVATKEFHTKFMLKIMGWTNDGMSRKNCMKMYAVVYIGSRLLRIPEEITSDKEIVHAVDKLFPNLVRKTIYGDSYPRSFDESDIVPLIAGMDRIITSSKEKLLDRMRNLAVKPHHGKMKDFIDAISAELGGLKRLGDALFGSTIFR